jgi:TfoX/Sxy family transcriptional regulator of competence genes/GNAT superfamily N-acetyltransferase
MRASDDFISYCCELLSSQGACTSRRMFGGVGIACNGRNIAFLADEVLYLKVNASTQERFRAAGGTLFEYETSKGINHLHYWTPPDAAMESRHAMQEWAALAMQAAMASKVSVTKRAKLNAHTAPVQLRDPLPGDIGTVISRHGALYAKECGYDLRFEAMVAKIAGEFVETMDPDWERCWIAAAGNSVLGSVFLMRENAEIGKLRLLYVEPSSRGTGLGKHLVQTCMTHARAVGYRKLTLGTQSELLAARGIYAALGWKKVSQSKHTSFGKKSIAEIWEINL